MTARRLANLALTISVTADSILISSRSSINVICRESPTGGEPMGQQQKPCYGIMGAISITLFAVIERRTCVTHSLHLFA